VGHRHATGERLTSQNCLRNCGPQWVTRSGHNRVTRGLSLRGSIYQYRVRVPADLRAALGCSHVKRSLKTDSRSLAIRLSRKVSFEIEAMFEGARRDAGLKFSEGMLRTSGHSPAHAELQEEPDALAISAAASPLISSAELTLSEVYARFLSDPTCRRSARTMLAHETTRRVVLDILGASTAVTAISREACRDLLETLRSLPVNFSKKHGQLSAREAATLGRGDKRIRTINPTNLNAYMARFSTMMNWAVAEEYVPRNPARGLQLAETVHPQDRRRPFELWQLQKIFNAPVYVGCRDEHTGYSMPGSMIATGARYWVPLIGLLSGMRLNEACQLDVADVRTIEGVHCFAITEESLVGSRDKSLKNKTSARIVPVHPILLRVGIMAFIERKRRNGSTKLFDDLSVGTRGFRSIAFSRWFSRFLVSAGAQAPRTCYHSFRHSFRDASRNARIDRDIALTLGGWSTNGHQRDVADSYGAGYRPNILYDAISAIEYPGLDLSHLGR
jgi:integrase